jgi:hypothetical protein
LERWRGGVLAAGKKGDIRRKLNVGVLRRKGKCIVSREEDKGHALRREQEEDLEKK